MWNLYALRRPKGRAMRSRPLSSRAAARGELLVYRIAGLPVAIRRLFDHHGRTSADVIRAAYALAYWQSGWDNIAEIAVASLLWPLGLLAASLWFTARNGPAIRTRERKGLIRQFGEQIRFYFTAGILPPWYYIFGLHGGGADAFAYLQRSETKAGIYPLLRRGVWTELNDKKVFADFCAEHDIPHVPYLLHLDGSAAPQTLPGCNLFVKPANGRGGRGAERWDWTDGQFAAPDGQRVGPDELLEQLKQRAEIKPILVQPRIETHRDLAGVTSGALPTVRVTTCLDERGDPEIVGAVFRMAIGGNRTVDNLHAGGIATKVALDNGELSSASNLGMDSKLGWLERHPDTGAPIAGRTLPFWTETKALAIRAHRSFRDRVLVGWDIAITDDGPLVVEGNSSPDLDIMQRFGAPICNSRFGELLAWHLVARGFSAPVRPPVGAPAPAAPRSRPAHR
jgi:glutathione synthase/RimK-type ligase-like ATP-grasp enzyme